MSQELNRREFMQRAGKWFLGGVLLVEFSALFGPEEPAQRVDNSSLALSVSDSEITRAEMSKDRKVEEVSAAKEVEEQKIAIFISGVASDLDPVIKKYETLDQTKKSASKIDLDQNREAYTNFFTLSYYPEAIQDGENLTITIGYSPIEDEGIRPTSLYAHMPGVSYTFTDDPSQPSPLEVTKETIVDDQQVIISSTKFNPVLLASSGDFRGAQTAQDDLEMFIADATRAIDGVVGTISARLAEF